MHRPNELTPDVAAVVQLKVVEKILEVICRTTGLGFSAVARVTDQQWIACAVRDEIAFGLEPGGELPLQTTICHEICQTRQAVAIDHVSLDARFRDHPTPKQYGFESYISVPITRSDGRLFGTLCAIGPQPAHVNTPETLGMFSLFADLIAQHLDALERLTANEEALAQERQIARLRDQFMAVLGHDLRNPLNAVLTSTELLNYLVSEEEAKEVVAIIRRSGKRMAELIENVLDFARGSMGGGIVLRRVPSPGLAKTLADVVQELQLAWPSRKLIQEISLPNVVTCDAARVAQVLSNLLANALTHGTSDRPIVIRAHCDGGSFQLSVTNHGSAIPPEIIDQLFKPFSRGTARPGAQGLGLGLYIASEVARAHGGTLSAQSSDAETRFTLCIPAS